MRRRHRTRISRNSPRALPRARRSAASAPRKSSPTSPACWLPNKGLILPAPPSTSMAADHRSCRMDRRVASLFVAIDLLALLVALLRFHRQGRDRPGFEALQGDRLAGLLAITVGIVL